MLTHNNYYPSYEAEVLVINTARPHDLIARIINHAVNDKPVTDLLLVVVPLPLKLPRAIWTTPLVAFGSTGRTSLGGHK